MKRSLRIWVWVVNLALIAGACSSAGRHAGTENPAFFAFDEVIRLYEAGEFIAAREAFTAIRENHPDSPVYPSSLYHLADIDYSMGNYRRSLGYIEEFLESFPQQELLPGILLMKGTMLADTGEIIKSIAVLQDVERDYPDSKEAPIALLLLANLAFLQRDYARAEVLLQRIIDEYPDSPQAENARSRIEIIPQYKYHDEDRYIPEDPLEKDNEFYG